MAIPLPIETERLLLRPFEPDSDAEPMLEVYGDPAVMRHIPDGVYGSLAAVRATLERYAREQESRGFSFWAVVERSSGQVIGDAGFGIFRQTGDIELGYTLRRDRWRRGYARPREPAWTQVSRTSTSLASSPSSTRRTCAPRGSRSGSA